MSLHLSYPISRVALPRAFPSSSEPLQPIDSVRVPHPIYYSCLISVLMAVGVRVCAQPAAVPEFKSVAPERREPRAFKIRATDASEALTAFSSQSGSPVVFLIDHVRGIRTNPVEGRFTPRQALDLLVAKTPLTVIEDLRTGALIIKRVPAPESPAPLTATPAAPASPRRAGLISALVAALSVPLLPGQTAPSNATAEQTITLSAFEVRTDRDVGYVATSALAGGRTDSPLKLTPSSVSAMTTEFIEDLAIGDMREALQWTLNAEPQNVDLNSNAQGSHLTNFRGTSGAGNYPSRNYFLFYGIGESYNTERFEFARGPNAVLFGDAQLGGVATTFTKVPRLNKNFYRGSVRYSYPSTGDGRWRGTFDVNQGVGQRLAFRVNALAEDGPSWRDHSEQSHKAVTLAGIFKLTGKTQVRLEGEKGKKNYNLFATNYGDGASYWNRAYTYDGTNALTPAAATAAGVVRQTAVRNVWIPAVPQAGLSNWMNSYQTSGTGLSLLPEQRNSVANFPVLPTAEFTIAPTDAYSRQKYRSVSLFLDHRFSEALQGQIGYYNYQLDNFVRNNVILGGYTIDVNEFLPNGLRNPKRGVAFAEVRPTILNPVNEVQELRALVTYKLELPKFFDLKQRFTLIAGARREHFETFSKQLQQVAGPNQNANFNAAAMQVFYRYYWDEPLKFGMSDLPNDPTRTLAFIPGNLVDQDKDLDYAQLSSFTTLFKERLSLVFGLRHDRLAQSQQNAVTNANVNNGIAQLGSRGIVGAREDLRSKATSPSLGFVGFVTPWLGVFGNYSKNFSPPSGGTPDVDGNSLEGPRGEGFDYGIKLSLLDGQIYATLTRYDSRQMGRIINIQAEITRLQQNWVNVRSDDSGRTSVDFRDTEEVKASGYEAEVVANPTRAVRLSAGIAFPETEIVERLPGLRRYFAANLSAWETALASGNVNDATALRNNINATRQTLESSTEGTRLDRTPDYRWNVYSSYNFSQGRWKGLSLGGGFNGRGRIKIGTVDPRILFNTAAPTNEQRRIAGFTEVKAPAVYTTAARIGYRFRLAGVRTNVQLNVNNVLDDDTPEWRSSGTYTPPGGVLAQSFDAFLRPAPRTFILTTSFDF